MFEWPGRAGGILALDISIIHHQHCAGVHSQNWFSAQWYLDVGGHTAELGCNGASSA